MSLTLASLVADERFPLHWDMSSSERLTLIALLDRLRPALSLEIGTYKGGSLQVLSHFSDRVIAVDVRPEVPIELAGRFKNVTFRIGDSRTVLPSVVRELNERDETPGFILIDGAHHTEGVRSDIESVLRLNLHNDVIIVMHDSFNPDCRRGMREAKWSDCPYVHEVNLDFVTGNISPEGGNPEWTNTMWGGFGCALLKRARRTQQLRVQEPFRATFDAVFKISAHSPKAWWKLR
jgi:hypothetical protein